MQMFMRGDANSKAMGSLKEVSKYVKVHGYWTNEIPTVEQAIMEGLKMDGGYMVNQQQSVATKCLYLVGNVLSLNM